jgi:sugar phosphate isomerase/epimerase
MMDWKELQPGVLEEALEYCKKLPCDCVVIGSLHLGPLAEQPDYDQFLLNFVKTAAETIRAAGFKTGFHNHDKDHFNKVSDGRTFFEFLFDNIKEDFMLMIDTGNTMGGGADPIELVKRYPHRTEIAHFKGYSAENTYVTPVWEAEIDGEKLLDTLLYDGDAKVLSIEFGRRGDYIPFERAARSYTWLADQLKAKNLL